ncbi:hypothetical protein [uncultured Roseibium sp.]|uniref:hypothetical protein n=1 Tax=uncultured Roseibium sp. TaxID=1936171 RepID=UPI00321677E2
MKQSFTQFQRDLSASLTRIADITLRQDPGEALKLYRQGLEIARRLFDAEPQNTVFQRELSVRLITVSTVSNGSERNIALQEVLEISLRLEKAGQLTADQSAWPDFLQQELAKK